ncbi:toxin-antitoxin system YwqK family antitoxin [Chitinophaga pinensis]|uniref:Antitoxin component YwqK of YwqJK toxin-antitoxin module n=1 Tax=Chitinophaga pinensis TaxID=79329 RepID=A0A5C6M1V3_9BACT|nr:hypothetical protein [Chitinophaga pinensis]TWW01929.1 hypothetical protein FEF09_01980 [Chitinophaga pinensis]
MTIKFFSLTFFIAFISTIVFAQVPSDTNKIDNNGKKTGLWITRWRDTSNISHMEYYIDGKKNGLCKYYNPDGDLVREIEYVNDTLHGLYRKQTPFGTDVSTFIHGKIEGLRIIYDYRKSVMADHMYKNGLANGLSHFYYSNGRQMTESTYINGKENGTRFGYADSNKRELRFATDFVDDIRVERRIYKKGKLVKTEKYDETGETVTELIIEKKRKHK